MSTINPDTTLGQLVNDHPQLAPRLERLGLDYCCGGREPLKDAVAACGLALDDVISTLSQEAVGSVRADWADMAPAELVDHIYSTHHVYLHEELPRLEALAAKVLSVHGQRHPELGKVFTLTRQLHAELEPHLVVEETDVFPAIRRMERDGELDGRIAALIEEHEVAGELLEQLRAVTGDYEVPADGCASYQALYTGLATMEHDTHIHVHKENNVLFPAVLGTGVTTSA